LPTGEAISINKPAASSLPHAIEDDNYLEALARFHAAVPQWLPRSSGFHIRTEVRMIDLNGRESNATVDHWQNGRLSRDEENATGWHCIIVWGVGQNWSTSAGISPLRLYFLRDLTPRPGPAERRIRIYAQGYVALVHRKINGEERSCSGEFAGAEICFDISTGYPASAHVDEERVVYEEWAQFNGSSYPSRIALYRGHRLQMEATTTVTPLEDASDKLFQPLPDVTPFSNQLGVHREDRKYKVLTRGEVYGPFYGEALVKINVDESGRVRHAELIDADDKSVGRAAVEAAQRTVYMPFEVNGHKVPFQTTFYTNHWSTTDPVWVLELSKKSLSKD
jgi:hypothetical protein